MGLIDGLLSKFGFDAGKSSGSFEDERMKNPRKMDDPMTSMPSSMQELEGLKGRSQPQLGSKMAPPSQQNVAPQSYTPPLQAGAAGGRSQGPQANSPPRRQSSMADFEKRLEIIEDKLDILNERLKNISDKLDSHEEKRQRRVVRGFG